MVLLIETNFGKIFGAYYPNKLYPIYEGNQISGKMCLFTFLNDEI